MLGIAAFLAALAILGEAVGGNSELWLWVLIGFHCSCFLGACVVLARAVRKVTVKRR